MAFVTTEKKNSVVKIGETFVAVLTHNTKLLIHAPADVEILHGAAVAKALLESGFEKTDHPLFVYRHDTGRIPIDEAFKSNE